MFSSSQIEEILACPPGSIYKRNGMFTYRESFQNRYRGTFFYENDKTEKEIVARISDTLERTNLKYRIIDSGTQYRHFLEGANLKDSSHYWVTFEILNRLRR